MLILYGGKAPHYEPNIKPIVEYCETELLRGANFVRSSMQ